MCGLFHQFTTTDVTDVYHELKIFGHHLRGSSVGGLPIFRKYFLLTITGQVKSENQCECLSTSPLGKSYNTTLSNKFILGIY